MKLGIVISRMKAKSLDVRPRLAQPGNFNLRQLGARKNAGGGMNIQIAPRKWWRDLAMANHWL
jgi:hypothetical protein